MYDKGNVFYMTRIFSFTNLTEFSTFSSWIQVLREWVAYSYCCFEFRGHRMMFFKNRKKIQTNK